MAKCLWITGAGKGIGRAVALEYASRGWVVAATARTASDLDDLAHDARTAQLAGRIVPFAGDVTDHDGMKLIFKSIEQDLQPVDHVILNAGTYVPDRVRSFRVEAFRAIFEVNVMGVVNGLAAILPTFLERRRGRIGVVASVAGYSGLPKAAAYGATKAALINMCESLRPELQEAGVMLSVINPGFVRTPLTDKNTFPMPFLMDAEVAADLIYAGMSGTKFEIAFPRPFVIILKLLKLLPYGLYFRMMKKLAA